MSLPGSLHSSPSKLSPRRLLWLASLSTLACLCLAGAGFSLLYVPRRSPCLLFSSTFCFSVRHSVRTSPPRTTTDAALASLAVTKDVLSQPRIRSSSPKVAFMFLTPGPLPHERLWEEFLRGHEGKYSIYVHASLQDGSKSSWTSPVFIGREIPSQKVEWGKIDMVDAERRLLGHALLDMNNEFFVLLSESCIPIQNFGYIYKKFMASTMSFVDSFQDPGPHGNGRYLDKMMPEIQKEQFMKGAQWFAVNRKHALLIVVDSLYYTKFRDFCKRGNEFHNCYPDEHYVQTFLHIVDPQGISNWSITFVDWSERKWHPRSYRKDDISLHTLQQIQGINESVHVTSDAKNQEFKLLCTWSGNKGPCYLFARKFLPETRDILLELFQNTTFLSLGSHDKIA